MIGSLFTGLSGIRSHQTLLEVIGNNISNTNTTGFKAGRATFGDILSQTLREVQSTDPSAGSANPLQLGGGVRIRSIDTLFTQGNLQSTDRVSDFAIEGDGFFVLSDGKNQFYTRAGAFDLNSEGYLTGPGGLMVQGKMAQDGVVTAGAAGVGNIQLPVEKGLPGKETTEVTLSGNLDALATKDQSAKTDIEVFDSEGNSHTITVTFTVTKAGKKDSKGKITAANWSWEASVNTEGASILDSKGNPITNAKPTSISFNKNDGTYIKGFDKLNFDPGNGTGIISIDLKADGIKQSEDKSSVIAKSDGYAASGLETFNVDGNGIITGVFSNGTTQALGQLVLADFNNPEGMVKAGENLFQTSDTSGKAILSEPDTRGLGVISQGNLEMSNVVLAEEFTNMILAQRGFQASANVITTTDTMLGDTINLKRA